MTEKLLAKTCYNTVASTKCDKISETEDDKIKL